MKILKNRKNSGRGPRAPEAEGREGPLPEFFRFFSNFQLCIERFFVRSDFLSVVIRSGQFLLPTLYYEYINMIDQQLNTTGRRG